MTAKNDLSTITASIQDIANKPSLRPTLHTALESLEHEQSEIIEALDGLFTAKVTLQ